MKVGILRSVTKQKLHTFISAANESWFNVIREAAPPNSEFFGGNFVAKFRANPERGARAGIGFLFASFSRPISFYSKKKKKI